MRIVLAALAVAAAPALAQTEDYAVRTKAQIALVKKIVEAAGIKPE